MAEMTGLADIVARGLLSRKWDRGRDARQKGRCSAEGALLEVGWSCDGLDRLSMVWWWEIPSKSIHTRSYTETAGPSVKRQKSSLTCNSLFGLAIHSNSTAL